MEINKPFIIRKNVNKTLLPIESTLFDDTIESYVRFVQGANAFIAIFEFYETFKMLYLHFSYQNECPDYSNLLIALGVLNVIWIWISLSGITSINSRKKDKVTKFLWGLIFMLVARIIFYLIMNDTMSNVDESNIIPVSEKWYCDVIYQGGLYIITAIIEAVVISVILILTRSIKLYIQQWEEQQSLLEASQAKLANRAYHV